MGGITHSVILQLDAEENRIVALVLADKQFTKKQEAIKYIIKEYKKHVKKIDM